MAAEQHRIRRLKGFGQKTEENILNGIRLVESSKGRMLLGDAYPAGKMMDDILVAQGVEHVSLAGSAAPHEGDHRRHRRAGRQRRTGPGDVPVRSRSRGEGDNRPGSDQGLGPPEGRCPGRPAWSCPTRAMVPPCSTSPAARSTTSSMRSLAIDQGIQAERVRAVPEGHGRRWWPGRPRRRSTRRWAWTSCPRRCARTAGR